MSEQEGHSDPNHRFGAVIAFALLIIGLYQLAVGFEFIESTSTPIVSDRAEGLVMLLGAAAIVRLIRRKPG